MAKKNNNHKAYPQSLWNESTRIVHGSQNADPLHGGLNAPLHLSTSFKWNSVEDDGGYEYSRTANPTRTVLEEQLAELENGQYCSTHGTGMAAATAVAHLFKQGDHVIISEDCYGGVFRLFNDVIRHFGVEVSFIDLKDLDRVRKAIRPNTKGLWAESPTNPLLRLVDIKALAEIANSADSLLVVDNTFCSPILQKPLDLGAHIVVHSLSKYVNGHSDVLGGAVITKDKAIGDRIHFLTNALGIGSPAFDSWLILRGIKTLKVRYSHQQKTTQAVAEWLQKHPKVKQVIFPGLTSHPDHELAKRQQKGFGAVISFAVEGGKEGAKTVVENTELCTLAESLGGVTTLIEIPACHSHASMAEAAREKVGINYALIRLSIGLEGEEDLIGDLDQALNQISEIRVQKNNQYIGSVASVRNGVWGA